MSSFIDNKNSLTSQSATNNFLVNGGVGDSLHRFSRTRISKNINSFLDDLENCGEQNNTELEANVSSKNLALNTNIQPVFF